MRLRCALLCASALLLAGCTSVPKTAPQLTAMDGKTAGLENGTSPAIGPQWWEALNDPQLNSLMGAALADNPTLTSALVRVRLASAALAEQRAGQLPQIGIDGSLERDRLSSKYIIPPPYGGSTRWMATTQATLNWNVDFWGRQAALIGQARASENAAALDADAARLALTSAVAQTYIELLRSWRAIDIANDFVTSRERSLALVHDKHRNNLASGFDVSAAETLLAEAQQSRIRAERDRTLAVHALAALVGRGADFYPEIKRPTVVLGNMLPLPQTLPADLLGRRPDLLAAQARIDAAVAGRRAARTAFYPNVNLKAFIGLQAIGLGSFFTSDAGTYGAGPAVHLPIFEGGRLRAQYEGATASVDSAIAGYNSAVLDAVREAADALTRAQSADDDAASQKQVLAGLSRTVHLNQVRMRTGLGSQLDILEAGSRLLEAQQAQAAIDASAAISRIQLLTALGGGFSPSTTSPSAGNSQ